VPLQSLELRLRPLAPSPSEPLRGEATSFRSLAGLASRGVLAPTDTTTSGAPFHHAPLCGGSCGVRIARPPPVPSSGFLPLSTVLASTRRVSGSCDPAVCRGPRRFAAFFHAARVPGASLQSFPFPGSRTRSRGPSCFLVGSCLDCRRRSARGGFTTAFPCSAPALCPIEPTRRWTQDA